MCMYKFPRGWRANARNCVLKILVHQNNCETLKTYDFQNECYLNQGSRQPANVILAQEEHVLERTHKPHFTIVVIRGIKQLYNQTLPRNVDDAAYCKLGEHPT